MLAAQCRQTRLDHARDLWNEERHVEDHFDQNERNNDSERRGP